MPLANIKHACQYRAFIRSRFVILPYAGPRKRVTRVEWHSVGPICSRVFADLQARRGPGRFDGLRRIGIDETSYRKGHKYITVVVDHDRGCLVWAHAGTGKDVLGLFLDGLTREQRRAIEVVTADGAKWIKTLVKRRYGFRNTDNLIALTMLRCSDMKPELPGRPPKEKKEKQAKKKAA